MTWKPYFDPITDTLNQIILGKEEVIQEILLSFLCEGHVLLKDLPGVGKTTLALAFSKVMGLNFKRIQFTPDIMPTDLTGFSVWDRQSKKFIYQPGIVFCNILLADEINRTSPKTQSSLLEVMEEGKVTVDGISREVPRPFFVIATQNPNQAIGTQELPEAQIDRFMIECSLGYPDFQDELRLAQAMDSKQKIKRLHPLLEAHVLDKAKQEIASVYVKDILYEYIVRLVQQTRNDSMIQVGASPRATLALVKLAKASSWYAGRDYILPEDIRKQFPYVMKHRILLSSKAYAQKLTKEEVLQNILKTVKVK